MWELAMGEAEVSTAEADGVIVEIVIPGKTTFGPLHKPRALDAFSENTLFRPDITPDFHRSHRARR